LGEGAEVRIKEDEIYKGERRFCFMARRGFSNKNVENVKKGPGVYKLFNNYGSLTYVGKAKNLKERLQQHLNEDDIPNIPQFEVKHTETTREVERMEKNIIQRSKPFHNIKGE
jgi:excinuclease ABC subunit C